MPLRHSVLELDHPVASKTFLTAGPKWLALSDLWEPNPMPHSDANQLFLFSSSGGCEFLTCPWPGEGISQISPSLVCTLG